VCACENLPDAERALHWPARSGKLVLRLALERVAALGAPARSVLCIGDSPATDVRGARLQGYSSLYVGTGLKQHGADFQAEVAELLASYGESATYAMTGLRW